MHQSLKLVDVFDEVADDYTLWFSSCSKTVGVVKM